MSMDDFRRYLNELDTLSLEIQQSPAFEMDAAKLDRADMIHRFNLHRTLVNLLHYAAVHMMRVDAHDYDPVSKQWVLSAMATALAQVDQAILELQPGTIRTLSMRAVSLVERMLADVRSDAA